MSHSNPDGASESDDVRGADGIVLPALFYASDQAAVAARRSQTAFLMAQLSLNVAAAGTSLIVPHLSEIAARRMRVLTATLAMLGLAVWWLMQTLRYDRTWFHCRAIAERTRTAAWRYMMNAPPYVATGDCPDAHRALVADLTRIRQAKAEFAISIAGTPAGQTEISADMRRVRAKQLADRKGTYLRERLLPQWTWYTDRVAASRRGWTRWFWIITGIQFLVLALLVTAEVSGGEWMDLVTFLLTVSTALIAWTELQRHEQISQSYAIAAQDLGALASFEQQIADEAQLREFVAAAEDVITREHQLWRVQRSISLPDDR